MRKSIFLMVLSLVAVLAVACGGGNAANNKANGAGGNGGDTANGGDANGGGSSADAWALYKKEGRSWMLKSTSKTGDMDPQVSFMKYEIVSVADDHAMQKLTMLDAEKKPNEYVPASETKIEFKTAETGETGDAPKVEQKEESIEVAGKKWDAIVTETEASGMKTKSWTSKEFPGLLLKSETTGETGGMKMNSTMELVEWNE